MEDRPMPSSRSRTRRILPTRSVSSFLKTLKKRLTLRGRHHVVPVNTNDLELDDIHIDDDEPTQHHSRDNGTKPKITIGKFLDLIGKSQQPKAYYELLDKYYKKLYNANLKTPIALPVLSTEPDTPSPHGGKKTRKTRRKRKTKTHKNKRKK